MNKLINFLDNITEYFGKLISTFSFLLVILICIDVFMRYVFDFTLIWLTELEIYFFAFIFLIGASYALKHDQHVRVDVFYYKLSDKKKAWINIFGALFLLLPWCFIIIWVSYNYAYFSFLMGEKSPQPGGLPALYILKFSICLAFSLLALQGISNLLKSIQVITKD